MNGRYGDNFLFSGADGDNVPFTWDGDTLLYRGVDVSASKGTDDYKKLEALANETNFVDIGIGLKEDEDGNLIESSAFNDALQGINYLGYGRDENGDPKNIACIIKQMGTLLSSCDENGNWASPADSEKFEELINKLETASSELKSNYVQLDAKASFLKSNNEQLEMNCDTLNEQFLDIEQCDLADAITSFSWAQYCYNAALKVGNQILSQSLIDYMD
jgi:flagellar hook-associated protein 3 FlgL